MHDMSLVMTAADKIERGVDLTRAEAMAYVMYLAAGLVFPK